MPPVEDISLRAEPVSHALSTFAMLAHPEWKMFPTKFDFAYAIMQAISGIDLVRAQLLAESALSIKKDVITLHPFDQLSFQLRERITYSVGERYDRLLRWLTGYHQQDWMPLDHFWRKLFGEVLAQPGFGFHDALSPV